MKQHELKVWPEYYYRIEVEQKEFELRRNDRDFQIGDILYLREWEPGKKQYTGKECFREIKYILNGHGGFGLQADYCIMSIKPIAK